MCCRPCIYQPCILKLMASYEDSDGCVRLLVSHLSSLKGSILIVADEHWSDVDWSSTKRETKCNMSLLSNRWDVHINEKAAGVDSLFSDFNFSHCSSKQFDSVIYRVSKERATTNHVINQAARVMKLGAHLYLSGKKNEGIKNYAKRSSKLLRHNTQAKKNGSSYLAIIKKNGVS